MYEDKDEKSKQECQANVIPMEDDKSCQSTLCSGKNCQPFLCDKNSQSSKRVHMWSVKPAMKQSAYKKFNQEPVCDDKNCQSTKSLCNDKNCQSAKCADMQKPEMPQSSYRKSSYKKCQVTYGGTQSSSLWSMSKTACKQIGTQPEVTRNNAHTVSPTHNHFVCTQAMCKHSATKSCFPPDSTKVSPVSRNYKLQSNHSDFRSSQMQSPRLRSVNPGKRTQGLYISVPTDYCCD